jgi:hypothetical protein
MLLVFVTEDIMQIGYLHYLARKQGVSYFLQDLKDSLVKNHMIVFYL